MLHHAGKNTITGTIVGAGVGAAAFFVATKAAQSLSFLQGKWWAAPVALLVAGHIAKRWSNPAGQAVVGAAGALLAFSYYVQSQTSNTQPTTQPASGFGSAGALQRVPQLTRYASGFGSAGNLARGPAMVMRG